MSECMNVCMNVCKHAYMNVCMNVCMHVFFAGDTVLQINATRVSNQVATTKQTQQISKLDLRGLSGNCWVKVWRLMVQTQKNKFYLTYLTYLPA